MSTRLIKQGILLFWALWLSIALLSNIVNTLINLGLIPTYWLFDSGNFSMVVNVVDRYSHNKIYPALMFTCVLLFESVIVVLFWMAVSSYRAVENYNMNYVKSAFAASLALWASFLIADGLLIAYSFGAVYFRLFTATLLSLLVFYNLPDE